MRSTARSGAAAPFILLGLALGLGLAGCTSYNFKHHQELLAEAIRARGLEPEAVLAPFQLSQEMHDWLDEKVPRKTLPEQRISRLLNALLSESGLELQYEGGYTGGVQEAFASRKANCLAFTHLFVSMARALGQDAYYLKVGDIHSYSQEGDLVISAGHITAATGMGQDAKILEFSQFDVDYRLVYPITDLTAVALYYSNRGGEALRQGETARALMWLETSIRLDPELLDGWANLGVARRRMGDFDGAEQAYRRALEIDPSASVTYQNLAALYSRRGDTQAAREVLELANRRSNNNPFTYMNLGDLNLRQGNFEVAQRFYRRALRLDPELAEGHAALGLCAAETGDLPEARRALRKARQLNPESDWVRRLEVRLTQVAAGP